MYREVSMEIKPPIKERIDAPAVKSKALCRKSDVLQRLNAAEREAELCEVKS